MRKATREALKRYLYDVIRKGEFDDPYTGEVNLTWAAESCLVEFPTLSPDSELPFEIAYEVAESLGK